MPTPFSAIEIALVRFTHTYICGKAISSRFELNAGLPNLPGCELGGLRPKIICF